jgi:hypothetical protein
LIIRYIGLLFLALSFNALAINEPASTFSIHSLSTPGGGIAIVRFNSKTGETYYRKKGKFNRVLDKTIIPSGSYDIELMSWPTGWGMLRINTKTGDSWVTKNFMWQKILNK